LNLPKIPPKIGVPTVAVVGITAFLVWASATNRLSLWSARFGAWFRSHVGSPEFWNKV